MSRPVRSPKVDTPARYPKNRSYRQHVEEILASMSAEEKNQAYDRLKKKMNAKESEVSDKVSQTSQKSSPMVTSCQKSTRSEKSGKSEKSETRRRRKSKNESKAAPFPVTPVPNRAPAKAAEGVMSEMSVLSNLPSFVNSIRPAPGDHYMRYLLEDGGKLTVIRKKDEGTYYLLRLADGRKLILEKSVECLGLVVTDEKGAPVKTLCVDL